MCDIDIQIQHMRFLLDVAQMLAQSSVINEIFHADMEYDQYYTGLIITMPGLEFTISAVLCHCNLNNIALDMTECFDWDAKH